MGTDREPSIYLTQTRENIIIFMGKVVRFGGHLLQNFLQIDDAIALLSYIFHIVNFAKINCKTKYMISQLHLNVLAKS